MNNADRAQSADRQIQLFTLCVAPQPRATETVFRRGRPRSPALLTAADSLRARTFQTTATARANALFKSAVGQLDRSRQFSSTSHGRVKPFPLKYAVRPKDGRRCVRWDVLDIWRVDRLDSSGGYEDLHAIERIAARALVETALDTHVSFPFASLKASPTAR